jgi:hypothetical protein
MSERCVVCGQPLPAGVSEVEMHLRLEKLNAAAAEQAATTLKRELDRQYHAKLAEQSSEIRKGVLLQANETSRKQLASFQKKLVASERTSRNAVERAVKDANDAARKDLVLLQRKLLAATKAADGTAKKAAKQAAAETARMSRKELDVLRERSAKERAQHAADTARLKTKVDELSFKLERQSSEQMGEMTEADALAALQRAFPHDDIRRIDRGVRGADIIHKVMVEGTEAGRIVYECKNVSTWQNEWLTKARGYRAEYQTQWVVIASRCFPRREKLFVVERGIPVIELRLIVKLAEVIRSAVIEIGSLRLTTVGRQVKATQMFEYILSDHFVSRFKCIGEAVSALRTQQEKERQWHAETWAKQARFYDEVESGRREIGAQIRTISEASVSSNLRIVAGDA